MLYRLLFAIGIASVLAIAPFSAQETLAQEISEAQEKPKLDFKPKIGGYAEGWFRSDSSDLSNQTTASKKVDNEFRVRRARIDARGEISDEIGYRVTANLDGPSPASGTSSVKLWDGYMAYKASPYAIVTVGQFKYDFTLEGYEGTPDRVPVLRAETINDIAGKLGTKGGSFRDIGIRISGAYKDFFGLAYGVSLINGSGINTGDNNGEKDIVGRVTVSPLANLTVGASAYKGTGQDETAQTLEVKESAYGFDAEYVNGGLRLRGEYVTGKWENWDVASATAVLGKTQKPNGWYLQASYRPPQMEKLELLARYEDYEKDAYTENSHLRTTTLGGTYYLKGKTRITANYLMRNSDPSSIVTAQETDAAGYKIGNLFLMQALVAF